MHVAVLIPVKDDWVSVREVLARIDAAFSEPGETVSALIVDDGSSEPVPPDFGAGPCAKLRDIQLLRLRKNLGHQRALAVGLCYISEKIACDAVLIMDGDGEDDPHDAVRLTAKLEEIANETQGPPPIIFAERTRRSESLPFRLGYLGYRILHYVLTGRGIHFGNFSIVPRARLGALVTEPMLWNHYAASVVGAKLPFATIPSHRGRRIAGKSRLNFVQLVIHGLSALSCYNDIIGVRLLFIASVLFAASALVVAGAIILKLTTTVPLLGWTSLFSLMLVVFLLQIITLAGNSTMQIIGARSLQPFLPVRDHVWYIDSVTSLYPRNA